MVSSVELRRSSLNEDGIIEIVGAISIQHSTSPPESLNPQDNPTRWRLGQTVVVNILNSSSLLVAHPLGTLFILEQPERPAPGQGIQIEVGGRLSYWNYEQLDGDKSGVSLGVLENCATVATRLLEAASIPSGNISLGTWAYSLNYPIGKKGGGFAAQAGELAYSNSTIDGIRYLYQNGSGDVVSGLTGTGIGTALITVSLGVDDARYEPIRAGQAPSEAVKAAGVGNIVTARSTTIETTESTGDLSDYETGNASCPGNGVIQRTTVRQSFNVPGSGSGDITFTTKSTLSAPRSAVYLDSEWSGGQSPCGLIQWKRIKNVRTFEQVNGVGGKLIREKETTEQRAFSLSRDRGNTLAWRDARIVTTDYSYDDTDLITQRLTTEEVAEATVDDLTSDPFRMQVARINKDVWAETGREEFKLTETEEVARIINDSSAEEFGANPWVRQVTVATKTSASGDTQPPRTEYWDSAVAQREVHYEGVASYTQPGGASGRTIETFFTVPYGFSDDQCQAIALLESKLQVGRYWAYVIELPITDALLTAPPLFRVDVIEGNGDTRHFLADGDVWSHTLTKASVVCTGIWIGTTPSGGSFIPADSEVITAQGANVTAQGAIVYGRA